jgi:hypothetical protein
MEKISNYELSRILGAYMWCRAQVMYARDSEMKIITVNATLIHELAFETKHCQLLLTPLDKITLEHSIWVTTQIFGQDAYKMHEVVRMDLTYQKKAIALCYPIIDQLREWGYDCGYGSIPSLIEAGTAIDVTTLNTQNK